MREFLPVGFTHHREILIGAQSLEERLGAREAGNPNDSAVATTENDKYESSEEFQRYSAKSGKVSQVPKSAGVCRSLPKSITHSNRAYWVS